MKDTKKKKTTRPPSPVEVSNDVMDAVTDELDQASGRGDGGRAKPVDVRRLLGRVDFSADNVIGAAVENANLFVDAIEYRRSCVWRKNAAKMAHETTEAQAELAIRKAARETGDKVTEGNIKALVLVDEDVAAAAASLAEAEELDEYSKLIVEVFRMRRDCLQIVKGLLSDEYGMQRAVEAGAEKLKATREKLRSKFPRGEEDD